MSSLGLAASLDGARSFACTPVTCSFNISMSGYIDFQCISKPLTRTIHCTWFKY
jgi:hypothetical protein